MAFLGYNSAGKNQVTLINGEQINTLQVPGTQLVNAVWSPDGNTLALHAVQVSDYSGRIVYSWLYFVGPFGVLDGVLFVDDESIERVVWSPDGKYVLVVRRPTQGTYLLNFSILNSLYQVEDRALGFTLTSDSYALLTPISWLP